MSLSLYDIYPNLITYSESSAMLADSEVEICAARDGAEHFLLISAAEKCADFNAFEGTEFSTSDGIFKRAELTHANAAALRKFFPWTAPVPVLKKRCSIGCGDRLGIATAAHADLFACQDAAPVFAQQSVRELTLTNRTFQSVIDDTSFQVFQAGFNKGFGADGDHLKTFDRIGEALDAGVTMLTLDLSDRLHPEFAEKGEAEVAEAYARLDPGLRARLEESYTTVPAIGIEFSRLERMRCALIYTDAMDFSAEVHALLKKRSSTTDLEISIDETTAPTLPEHHWFVAGELAYRHVPFASLAPRFIGEFQKGIDYIGDLTEFERQFAVHAKIADHFGFYKLSIHSGSDKFAVFPIIGRLTRGRFHLKTAGTSWLEAVAAIAENDPKLFRQMYNTAFATLADARKLYHVTADFAALPAEKELTDAELPKLLAADCVAGRQLMHITYGAMLGKDRPALRKAIYTSLAEHEDEYYDRLDNHFTRHLSLLGVKAL